MFNTELQLTSYVNGDIKSKALLSCLGLATRKVCDCILIGMVKLIIFFPRLLIVNPHAAMRTLLFLTIYAISSGIVFVISFRSISFAVKFVCKVSFLLNRTTYVKFNLRDSSSIISNASPL